MEAKRAADAQPMAFHTDADKIRKEAEASRINNVNLGVAMKMQQDDSEFP